MPKPDYKNVNLCLQVCSGLKHFLLYTYNAPREQMCTICRLYYGLRPSACFAQQPDLSFGYEYVSWHRSIKHQTCILGGTR
jgi:hypothetical protein